MNVSKLVIAVFCSALALSAIAREPIAPDRKHSQIQLAKIENSDFSH